jgi:hypothetical protein
MVNGRVLRELTRIAEQKTKHIEIDENGEFESYDDSYSAIDTRRGVRIIVGPESDSDQVLEILVPDFAGGGEAVSMDIGIYTDGEDMIPCVAKTIRQKREIDGLTNEIGSNEPRISDIIDSSKHVDGREFLIYPFTTNVRESPVL